ncbi:MAG TPA: Ku protein [Thermoanaerobaculia bacterium]|jgi:DNA end-binding protein Ku
MRAIWSGTIGFGLVTIPVSLHSAVEASERVSFRQLHKKDKSPIKYKKFCSKEDKEVPASEIVRGFEISKGRYSIVEQEALEGVKSEMGKGSRTIDVLQFVPFGALNPLSFDNPYYLAPGKGGEKAYVLLRDALQEAGRVGIVRFFLRTRPVLGALIGGPRVIALEALRTFDELRNPSEIKIPKTSARPSEVKLAKSLIDQMSEEDWDPAAHPDDYEKALRKLLSAKPTFGLAEAEAEAAEGADNVVDLMEALRRSVAKTREKAPRRTARRRGAA